MNTVHISVVIVTYKRLESLNRCLESLRKQTYPSGSFEVIIVDNGQSESVRTLADTYGHMRMTYVPGPGKGPSIARNIGVQKAAGEIVAFVDDDGVAEEHWLEEIDKTFQKFPSLPACGGEKINMIEGKLFKGVDYSKLDFAWTRQAYFLQLHFTPLQLVDSDNLAIKREVFLAIGGFNEKFAWAGDAPDFVYTLLEKGYQLYFNPALIVYHYTKHTLKGVAEGMFKFGVSDAQNLKDHFSRWFVFDLHIMKIFKKKQFWYRKNFPVTCCIRLDLLKCCVAFILMMLYNPNAGLITGFILLSAAVAKCRNIPNPAIFFIYSLYREFWYFLGHIVGSVRSRVIYL